MHKVLITGSKGLLGIELLRTVPSDFEIIPTVNTNNVNDLSPFNFLRLDILNKKEVFRVVDKLRPDVIIHAASLGNVDYCEKNQEEAYAVNVTGTENILQACLKYDCKLIFTSSNAVFDGTSAPYSYRSVPHPLNYYGKTKLLSEKMIASSGVSHVIVRLLLLYGWHHPLERANPVTWIIEQLKNKREVSLVNDVRNNPMLSTHAAQCIWKMIQKDIQGIIHIAGHDVVSRFELGTAIAEVFGLDRKYLTEVTSAHFGSLAPRMPDTTYDTSQMTDLLGLSPFGLLESLNYMKGHPLRLG
ncbi:MAG: NAD(P)-dependent oxidoreductase [bacterium]